VLDVELSDLDRHSRLAWGQWVENYADEVECLCAIDRRECQRKEDCG
jgi:hypothetical protein